MTPGKQLPPLSALWLGAVGVGGMHDWVLISPSCPDRSCFGEGICLEKVAKGGSAAALMDLGGKHGFGAV